VQDLGHWIGRSETALDAIGPTPVKPLTATLDHPAAPAGAAWQRELVPDDVLLFRYGALTFDGHAMKLNGQREGPRVRLWVQDHEGWLTMDAVATLKA
jgi:hydroxyacyl-ACP dehydratase HTD2-like protein with hotdog domain